MKKNDNMKSGGRKGAKLTWVLVVVAAVLVIVLGVMLCLLKQAPEDVPETLPPTEPPTQAPTDEPTELPTEPDETEPPVMLEHLAVFYEQNQDTAGWLKINDTVVDYLVMHAPEEFDKYLRTDFYGNRVTSGMLFVDEACSFDPESDNLIIHGHNMSNGSMFHDLLKYKDKKFWEEHPEIQFSTLYEERTYEVLAAFYDKIYMATDDVFKFYQFIDAEDEAHYDEAIAYFKDKAEYDTGVTAEYGDKLLTLVTCSYHTGYGRFVVVAREVTDDAVQTSAE